MTTPDERHELATYLDSQNVEARISSSVAVVLHERPMDAGRRIADILISSSVQPVTRARQLSLPKEVVASGGIDAWNEKHLELRSLKKLLMGMCLAQTPDGALSEVRGLMALGQNLMAYAYMRTLYNVSPDLFYATLLASPQELLPVVYTPTVGEACQKFGRLPFFPRGCYVAMSDRGRVAQVLQEYAAAELTQGADGRYLCDCIVFSDGGRILGLGDLGAWGMGIPIGKLDLYTVCAGVNPYRTMPVIIDAGCFGPEGNTDKIDIRGHKLYTGSKNERTTHTSDANTVVNSAYYGPTSLIGEFMTAAANLFGAGCLLQFEDFNSNGAAVVRR